MNGRKRISGIQRSAIYRARLLPSVALDGLPLPLVLADALRLPESAGRAFLLADVIAPPTTAPADYVDLLVLLPEAWGSFSWHDSSTLIHKTCAMRLLLERLY